MPFQHWENFVEFAHKSIRRYYSDPESSFEAYCHELTRLVSEVIGERSRTLIDPAHSHEEKIDYIERILFKINTLDDNLFEVRSEGLLFQPDKFLITDDLNDEISSARQLKRNIVNLRKEFEHSIKRIPSQTRAPVSSPQRRERIPSRGSFELIPERDVNLRAVHRHLTDQPNPFIDPTTTYEDFERAFSGAPVTSKISWLYANALHYFIENIHGVGVDRANEGKWKRASRCFTVKGKDITPDQIKDAGDPVATVTAILDRAIEPFL